MCAPSVSPVADKKTPRPPPRKKKRGRPEQGIDASRSAINATTKYGVHDLFQRIAALKTSRDVEKGRRPKITLSRTVLALTAFALEEDPDFAAAWQEVEQDLSSKDAEEKRAAELVVRHWEMLREEADLYRDRMLADYEDAVGPFLLRAPPGPRGEGGAPDKALRLVEPPENDDGYPDEERIIETTLVALADRLAEAAGEPDGYATIARLLRTHPKWSAMQKALRKEAALPGAEGRRAAVLLGRWALVEDGSEA